MTFKLVDKNGKKYLEMTSMWQGKPDVEYAKVYDLKGEPYIKRMSQKIYLTAEMLAGETLTF